MRTLVASAPQLAAELARQRRAISERQRSTHLNGPSATGGRFRNNANSANSAAAHQADAATDVCKIGPCAQDLGVCDRRDVRCLVRRLLDMRSSGHRRAPPVVDWGAFKGSAPSHTLCDRLGVAPGDRSCHHLHLRSPGAFGAAHESTSRRPRGQRDFAKPGCRILDFN